MAVKTLCTEWRRKIASAQCGSRIVLSEQDTRREIVKLLPELRAYARFLVRSSNEADDLVQESLTRALTALPQFVAGTNLRAWLFTILRNTFFETARRRRVETAAIAQSTETQEQSTAAAQADHIDLDDLRRHLFQLPPLLRDALVLVGAQGLSYEEAAAIAGVPVGTVKARVSRARSQLARSMSVAETERV